MRTGIWCEKPLEVYCRRSSYFFTASRASVCEFSVIRYALISLISHLFSLWSDHPRHMSVPGVNRLWKLWWSSVFTEFFTEIKPTEMLTCQLKCQNTLKIQISLKISLKIQLVCVFFGFFCQKAHMRMLGYSTTDFVDVTLLSPPPRM